MATIKPPTENQRVYTTEHKELQNRVSGTLPTKNGEDLLIGYWTFEEPDHEHKKGI